MQNALSARLLAPDKSNLPCIDAPLQAHLFLDQSRAPHGCHMQGIDEEMHRALHQKDVSQ